MIDYPFWVNNFDRVKDHRLKYPEVAKIFDHPVAFWYGAKKNKNAYAKLTESLQRLLKRTLPGLPYFVIYNLPERDTIIHVFLFTYFFNIFWTFLIKDKLLKLSCLHKLVFFIQGFSKIVL